MNVPHPPSQTDIDARRKRARRLALWVGIVAVAVYAGFIVLVGLSK